MTSLEINITVMSLRPRVLYLHLERQRVRCFCLRYKKDTKMKPTYFCIAKVKVVEDPSKTNTTCTGSLKEGKHINDDEEKGESSTTNDEGKGEAVSTNSEGKKEIGSTVPSSVGDYFLQIDN